MLNAAIAIRSIIVAPDACARTRGETGMRCFLIFFCFSGVHDVRSRSRRGAKLEMIVDITTCQKRGSTMINHDYLCLGSGNDSSIDVRSRYPFRSTAKLVSTVGLEERCFKWASIVQ